jgi:hypothetical protein
MKRILVLLAIATVGMVTSVTAAQAELVSNDRRLVQIASTHRVDIERFPALGFEQPDCVLAPVAGEDACECQRRQRAGSQSLAVPCPSTQQDASVPAGRIPPPATAEQARSASLMIKRQCSPC